MEKRLKAQKDKEKMILLMNARRRNAYLNFNLSSKRLGTSKNMSGYLSSFTGNKSIVSPCKLRDSLTPKSDPKFLSTTRYSRIKLIHDSGFSARINLHKKKFLMLGNNTGTHKSQV